MEIQPLISSFFAIIKFTDVDSSLIFPLDMCFDMFVDLQYGTTDVKLF